MTRATTDQMLKTAGVTGLILDTGRGPASGLLVITPGDPTAGHGMKILHHPVDVDPNPILIMMINPQRQNRIIMTE